MVDDVPVGGGGGGNKFGAEHEQPPSQAAGNADDGKPLDERLVSKAWASRKTAFEELIVIIQKFDKRCSNQVMNEHASKWPTYLLEPNPGAMEKVLECFHVYIDKCDPHLLSSIQNSIYAPMLDKCLGAAKPNLKTKSMECMMLIFEVSENFGEETLDALQAQVKSNKPKLIFQIALTALQLLAELMLAFGIRRFSPARFTPQIRAAADSSAPATRIEAMNCYKAIYQWVGEAGVQPFIEPLKDAQKVQLKKDFEAIAAEKKTFKKKTRTEQEAARSASLNDAINAAIEEEKKEEAIDVFDISMPQDILSQFGPDWATATLEIKKWDVKKAILDVVITAADVPKLAPGNYSGLFEVLKKLVADAHITVSQFAIRAIGCLAKGLRASFKDYALQIVPVLFSKFKEKRLTEEIQTTLERLMMSIDLGECCESLTAIKTEKMPLAKMNMAIFMEKSIRMTYIDQLEEIVDKIAPLAVFVSDDKETTCRDQGLVVLGVLSARVPNEMEKYLRDIIEAKKSKINAAKETVKISKYDKSNKKAAAAEAAAKKKAAADAKAKPKVAAADPTKKKPVAMTFGDDVAMNDESQRANDGVLDEVVPAKPLGKKPVLKKTVPVEAEVGLEQPEAPKKGPPARLAGKAAAAAPSGKEKVVKADDIQEEEIGSGLSKDQAIEKASEFYDAQIIAKFEETKWQDKVEGFNGLKEAIESLKPDKTIVEATLKFVKAKMKDFKESNINLMKETANIFLCLTQHCEDIPKRAVSCFAPFLCEKIGDIKMSAVIKDGLMNAAESCTAKYVSIQIVKKGLETKAPNNIKESCNFLAQLIEEFGAGRVAIKECIDFAVSSSNNANKDIRNCAMALFAVLYKHLGEKTNQFLDGVKPATMQLIQAEFEKVTPYAKGEFQCKRKVKGEAAEAQATGGKGGGGEPDALAILEGAMPRIDISKALNAKVIKMFTEADWKLKVKGCETVQGILKDAGMRIMPEGLGDLMEQLKVNFKASNKAVLKQVILLMGLMADATGQPIIKFKSKCFMPLLGFLGDKAALMRADVIVSADKWSEAIGAEHVIQCMCTYLTDGNPEMRTECLKWICDNKAAIAKCDYKEMVKPLINCMTDKSGPIRTMTEELIVVTMRYAGFSPFQEGIKDLKPALQQTVRPLLDKAKQKMIASNPAGSVALQENEEEDDKPAAASIKKPIMKGGSSTFRNTTKAVTLDESLTASPSKNSLAATASKKAPALGPTRKTDVAAAKPAPIQDPDNEEFKITPGNKEKRAAADAKNKWVHDELKPQHSEACKTSTQQIFGEEVSKLMWGADFKKHVQVIEKMETLFVSAPAELMECVDVIFKWTAIKLAESQNTAFQSGVYDFYQKLFDFLISQNYLLWEHEADVVIPLLCDKAGNNNAVLRTKVKQLIKMCFDMHDPKKTLLLMIKFGAMNKNLKSAGESLDEIAIYLKTQDTVPFGEQQIKVIAKLVDSKDASVRENSICVLSEIYKVLDEDIWRVVGVVPLKVKGLLETRFKKVKGGGLASSFTPSQTVPVVRPSAGHENNSGQETLTKSFNPGLKSQMQTPKTIGLKFNPKQDPQDVQQQPQQEEQQPLAAKQQQQQQQQPLTRSFRPNTAQQSNLTKSFGNKVIGGGFNAQPQTAFNQVSLRQDIDDQTMRQTLPPPTTNSQFGGVSSSKIDRKSDVLNFHPPQNNEMRFADDDEDLRQQIQEMEGTKKETLDPETQRQVDDIMKYISNLKYSSDLNKRVESLIALNEIIQAIQKHEKGIQHTANDLISAFTHVLIDIFERPRQDTPLRFAKYFVTIVNKTCQCSTIMSVVREQELYELGEQLLTRLLIDNLDKLGDEKEGEFILKNLNGSMLRCLENCNKTSIFCVLFNLLRRYKDTNSQAKLPGLIIKCLLKLSKILEKVINELEIERVLLVIHLYLIQIDHERKTSNDEMGIRIVKTLVHEMVKIKQHSILECYRVVENHEVEDKHLHRWIKIILNTFDPSAAPSQGGAQTVTQPMDSTEISQIIQELKSTDTFQMAIPKLHNFLTRNPHLSLDYYIRDLSQHFQDMIKQNLETFRNQHSDSGSTPNGKVNLSQPSHPQERPGFGSSQSSDAKKFGFRANAPTTGGGFNEAAQKASAPGGTSSTSKKQTFQSQPSGSKTLEQPGTGADSSTSTDRINSYQTKLSSMREKFQQRKTLAPPEPTNKSQSMAAGGGQTQQQAAKNLGASFSAMNSSLQQQWKAAQTKTGTTRESVSGVQLSSTMVGGIAPSSNRFSTEVMVPSTQNLTSSQNALRMSQGAAGETPGKDGASNQELNKRLIELRSKLANLRKN